MGKVYFEQFANVCGSTPVTNESSRPSVSARQSSPRVGFGHHVRVQNSPGTCPDRGNRPPFRDPPRTIRRAAPSAQARNGHGPYPSATARSATLSAFEKRHLPDHSVKYAPGAEIGAPPAGNRTANRLLQEKMGPAVRQKGVRTAQPPRTVAMAVPAKNFGNPHESGPPTFLNLFRRKPGPCGPILTIRGVKNMGIAHEKIPAFGTDSCAGGA